MINLLENQKIRKRKSYGHLRLKGSGSPAPGNSGKNTGNSEYSILNSSDFKQRKASRKPAFRPAGIISLFQQNSRLIEVIRQRPARNNYRKYPAVSGFNDGRANTRRQKTIYDDRNFESPSGDTKTRLRAVFFSLPSVIPVSAILLLLIGTAIILYNNGFSLDWMNREVVSAEKDQGSEYNLALYAGINPVITPSENSLTNSGDTIPLDLIETFSWQNYKVKKGDSVSKIAAAFSVSMDAIIASNNITNARRLREGETIRIPNMDGIPYTVKGGDSLSGISQSMGVPLEAILDANDIQNDKILAGMNLFIPGARMKREELKMALGEQFIYPLKGAKLSSPFGWRNDPFTGVRSYHAAVDLSAPMGTPIKAAMDGKVSALGTNATYGNYIIISHPGGFQTMYAHLNSFSTQRGAELNQGAQIGTVGSTGYSTGPHLHFAVFKNGRALNPLDFLNPQK